MVRVNVVTCLVWALILSALIVPWLVLADPSSTTKVVEDAIAKIEQAIDRIARRIVELVKNTAKIIALALFAVGVVLWATGISIGRARQLILGSIVLYIIAEIL